MATSTSFRRAATLAAAALAAIAAGMVHQHHGFDWRSHLDADERGLVGFAGHVPDSKKPKITAFFPAESYGPLTIATLHVADAASRVRLQVFHAGTSMRRIRPT